LGENGIGCGVHYKPLYKYQIFGKQKKLKITEKVFKEIITLPLHCNLTKKDIIRVCEKIDMFYA
jgi:dTDP-4-amino-4,6-dideoxygalactose transaminase